MALDMKTGKLADIASLDHVNILTPDVNQCRKFYVDTLGFEEGLDQTSGSRVCGYILRAHQSYISYRLMNLCLRTVAL